MREIIRKTYSVCPVCLKRIPAVHAAEGKTVTQRKLARSTEIFCRYLARLRIRKMARNLPSCGGKINCPMPAACALNTGRAPAVSCWR